MTPMTSTHDTPLVQLGKKPTVKEANSTVRRPVIEARWGVGAGEKGKSTHSSIEAVLAEVGFRAVELRAIYYGNWLRDYSQLLDPKIVRAINMRKDFPNLLSREALTRLVDVLAVKEFHDLMYNYREEFRVTPERLGVYRPSEHIDNPKVINPSLADPRIRDADFEPWVLPGDPLLEVDPETSMKRYIQRSSKVMQAELDKALKAGLESTDALRAFGAALHILEDFFAHSNFVELSLIKMGHTRVLPWTSVAECKHGLPLVTGMFGSTDVISSLAAPLGKILFSIKNTEFAAIRAGERTERDQIIQILLSEHPEDGYQNTFEKFLALRDEWADLPGSDQVEKVLWYLRKPGVAVGNVIGTAMQGMLKVIGNSIGDAQTEYGQDPNTSGSTDPSHSQLAKDHAEHPLHGLGALLAQEAVRRVGQAMLDQWLGKPGAADAKQIAADFFTNPWDSSWQDEMVERWAEEHPYEVTRATNKSALDYHAAQLREASLKQLEQFKQGGEDILEKLLSTHNPLVQLWKRTLIGWFLTRKK